MRYWFGWGQPLLESNCHREVTNTVTLSLTCYVVACMVNPACCHPELSILRLTAYCHELVTWLYCIPTWGKLACFITVEGQVQVASWLTRSYISLVPRPSAWPRPVGKLEREKIIFRWGMVAEGLGTRLRLYIHVQLPSYGNYRTFTRLLSTRKPAFV